MEAEIFRQEAGELLDDIEEILMEMRDGAVGTDQLNHIFRAFHTIKGSGAMFGFDRVAAFTHEVESSIDAVRQGIISFSPRLLELLLASRDHILVLIEKGESDFPACEAESARLREGLRSLREPEVERLVMTHTSPATTETLSAAALSYSDPPPPSEPIRPRSAPESAVAKRGNLRTLVVEDEFVCRCLLQEFLGRFGVSYVAVDGYEAILAVKTALAEKRPYDLVCLDIMMPGMDGREVAKEIRRLETDLGVERPCRIVMTTGLSEDAIVLGMFQSRLCDAYMVKPLNYQRLRELIFSFF